MKAPKYKYCTFQRFSTGSIVRTPIVTLVDNKVKANQKQLQKLSLANLFSIAYFCCNKGLKQLLINHILDNAYVGFD